MGSRSFCLESLGCAKNQVDAERIVASLEKAGWSEAENADSADLILINTCGFIEPAKQESINVALSFRSRYPNKKIILAGCLAQRYPESLHGELSEVDAVVGNRDLDRVVEAAEAAIRGERPLIVPTEEGGLIERRRLLSSPGTAYLKIAEGCDNWCSYCAIPLIRGRLRSRPIEGVVAEARGLLARGVFELNLVAQDLGAFGVDRGGRELPELLEALGRIDGNYWIRLLYIHPEHLPPRLLDVLNEDGRILPYFDLPFQHASVPVLRAMGRHEGPDDYLRLIDRIRTRLPDAVIRSTFLLGFPGETEADVEALGRFQAQAELDWAGFFGYSVEEGTAAADLPGRISKRTVEARKAAAEATQAAITARRLARFVGRTLTVLVEEEIAGEGLAFARGYPQAPEVDGLVVVRGEGLVPGQTRRVRITGQAGVDLEAVG